MPFDAITAAVRNSVGMGKSQPQALADISDFRISNQETGILSQAITGTDGDDTLNGTDGSDEINGLGGDDTIEGLGADDILNGGAGHDTIYGGAGNDSLDGGDGFDILDGGEGADTIIAGLGGDRIYSSFGGDTIDGGIDENADYWDADFSASTVGLTVNLGETIQVSNATTVTNVEVVQFTSGSGDDQYDVSRLLYGKIDGGAGSDALVYRIDEGYGFQYVLYLADDGTIAGSTGPHIDEFVNFERVEITGTAFDDYFSAIGNFDDASVVLNGGEGNDRLSASMVGSNGSMDFVVNADGTVTSNNGQFLNFESFNFDGGNGADNLVTGSGNDFLEGHDGNDFLSGGGGTDRIFGGNGVDTILGGTGDDFLTGDFNADMLDGGEGFDTVDFSQEPDGHVHVNLSATATIASGNRPALASNTASDSFTFIDTLISIEAIITGYGNDSVIGSDAANRIATDAGNDFIDGRGGDDVLLGGDGADTLTGGSGNDSFVGKTFEISGDTITDFASGDRLVITDANVNSFTFSLNGSTLTYTGGSLTLTGGVSGTLVASAAAGGGVQLTVSALAIPDVRNDFNGDGRSDILWRNADGTITNWLANGNGTFASNHVNATYNLSLDFTVAATGDFNGDGRDDLLLRHDNGTVTDWLGQANGGFVSNHAVATYALGTNWTLAGTGDFNGDGRDDILWRNEVGAMSQWLGQANGGLAWNPNAGYQLATNWQAVATADFNGDGRDDMLWRNEVGAMSQWLGQANGSFVYNPNAAYQLATNWDLATTGDFNGDGRDDILWRNEVGAMSQWLANADGTLAYNPNAAYQLATNWALATSGDFNGDGQDDLLWRNEVGAMSQWLAQAGGTFAYNPNAAYQLATNWQVQPEQPLV